MKRYTVRFNDILLLLILVGVVGLSGSCASEQAEGFAIYLTRDDIPPSQIKAFGSVALMDEPFIGANDIMSYNQHTYELQLTSEAFERIRLLAVPTGGKTFIVCVDKKPVYWGAFWTQLSSQSFDGVTIWQPLMTSEPYLVKLKLGYPSESFYSSEDPRNKPDIIRSFKNTGVLLDTCNLSDIKALPRSMKGYELYSWQEADGWHYKLITGTNRNKTLEEIMASDRYISESGWISIHCTGTEAIKAVLSKIPPGESVCWLKGSFISGGHAITYPSQPTLDEIKACADTQGLELILPGS